MYKALVARHMPVRPSLHVCPSIVARTRSRADFPARLSRQIATTTLSNGKNYENRRCGLQTICNSKRYFSVGTPTRFSGTHSCTAQPGVKSSHNAGRRRYKVLLITLALGTSIAAFYVLRENGEDTIFDPPRFTPFTIIKREIVSPTSIILTLRPDRAPSTPDPYKEYFQKGTWSVEMKQPELQIARSYTPLPPMDPNGGTDLRFLIRKEHKGEMSAYLHALPEGSKIELRGPKPEFDVPQEVSEVVFLAGGTGIAPALQLAFTLLECREADAEKPRIRIAWANRRREDCEGGTNSPLKQQGSLPGYIVRDLQRLQQKHPDHLIVDYLVDEEGSVLNQKKVSQLSRTQSEVKFGPVHTRIDSRLMIVSGPEGFVNFLAGPKKWEGGKEGQGEIGGVLGRMKLRDWKVWKL